MKKVTRNEFEKFIKDYPRKLCKNGYNDTISYDDFTLGTLDCSTVARINLNMYEGGVAEYLIDDEPIMNDKGELIIKVLGIAMVVAVVLVFLAIEISDCDGQLVRGLFWLECIE